MGIVWGVFLSPEPGFALFRVGSLQQRSAWHGTDLRFLVLYMGVSVNGEPHFGVLKGGFLLLGPYGVPLAF